MSAVDYTQQRCKRCEAYLSDKRPAGRTLCEDCMKVPDHHYYTPVIIPPAKSYEMEAKSYEMEWPLPHPPCTTCTNISKGSDLL